jgi:hypothetical protein
MIESPPRHRVTSALHLDIEPLRAWGSNLDDSRFSAALCALGALLAASGPTLPKRVRRRATPREVAAQVRSLLKGPVEQVRRVPWSIAPLLDKRGEIASLDGPGLDPETLADAWIAVIAGTKVWNRSAVATLEIDPTRFDLASLESLTTWLGPTGAEFGAFVTERGLGTGAYFQWPMRVAVAPGPESSALRDRLYAFAEAEHDWVNTLVEFTDPKGPNERCELLLAPWPLDETIERLDQVRHGIDASCLIALRGPGGATSMTTQDLKNAIESSVDPWAVCLVDVDDRDLGPWFTELVRQLSHDLTIDQALRVAAYSASAPLVIADPDALWRMGVRATAIRAVRALPTVRGAYVDLPPLRGFPHGAGRHPRASVIRGVQRSGAFDFEDSGARGTSDLGRYLEEDLGVAAEPPERSESSRSLGSPGRIDETVERSVRRAARRPKGPRPTKLEQRYLLGQVLRRRGRAPEERVTGRLVPLTDYILDIRIGEPDPEWIQADRPIPPDVIPRDGQRHKLRVVFDPGGRAKPSSATIELPATGTSTTCRFGFRSSNVGRLNGRLTVLFRNRVLQTALATSDDGFRIKIESVVRPGLVDLSPRRAFDLAFVHNHDGDGNTSVTAMSDGWVAKVPPRQLSTPIDLIRRLLTDAATNARAHTGLTSKATVTLMFKLARHGRMLRNLVVPPGDPEHLGDPTASPYVQVVSADPSAIFPVELFYDFPTPNLPPTLCPNAANALSVGRCDPAKYHGAPSPNGTIPVVCPAGFWSMNRVIERYASPRDLIPDLVGHDFLVRSEPIGNRNHLGDLSNALFAYSDLVEKQDAKMVSDALAAATNGKARAVDTWTAWLDSIKSEGPGLLVLLSHTDQDKELLETALIISRKEECRSGEFGRLYVRDEKFPDNSDDTRPGPLVFLLGCDTARVLTEYQSFVVLFRENHAALVVGTVASVAARHAPSVAAKLVQELAARTAAGAARRAEAFGDVLLSARRQLLSDGEVMALCLTSYGDADWRFG